MSVFIYALNDPETGKCRYVGKATNPKRRFQAHLDKAKLANNHKNCWILGLRQRGLAPILEVLDEVPAEEWEFWEQEYIRVFRMINMPLLNVLPGGEGVSPGFKFSEEARENMRRAQTGRKHSEETRAKMRANHSGGGNPMFGRRGQSEAQQAAHARSRGRPKGPWSEDRKKRCGEARKKLWASSAYANVDFSTGQKTAARSRKRNSSGRFS